MHVTEEQNAWTLTSRIWSERNIAFSPYRTFYFSFLFCFSHSLTRIILILTSVTQNMPRAKSVHATKKITHPSVTTISRSKSVVATPPIPTPTKRGRGRPPKVPKAPDGVSAPKVPSPESSGGEYCPDNGIPGTPARDTYGLIS
jgi:hypothetical protein